MSIFRHDPDRTVEVRSFGVTFQTGQTLLPPAVPPRIGAWHQLIYATRGVMTVRTGACVWVVPPHRAVWIPAGFQYQVEMSGVVALRKIYVRARRRRTALPVDACTVVNVAPLLRELILRTVHLGALDTAIPAERRLIGVLLDELNALVAVPLQLPLPQDQRAARFATLAGEQCGQRLPIERILRACGASRRTMERLFRAGTGMSLGQWLRRQNLLHALRRLAAGESVNNVALELGFNSASAFIAMFRRELGQTPRSYFHA